MNFKKFKRLLSVTLSASMLLSTNMTALAAETTAPAPANTAVEQETHQHSWQLEQELKPATCDEAGIAIYGCETEGCGAEEEKAIDVLGHDFNIENGEAVCGLCGYSESISGNEAPSAESNVAEHAHTFKKIARVAPTCWAEGVRVHYICNGENGCGKLFLSQSADTETTMEELKIAKLDHQPIRHAATAYKNCTTDIREYFSCSNCDRLYGDLEAFQEGAGKAGTEGTDWFAEEADFKVNDQGHNYSDNAYSFDWTNLDEDNFTSGGANGVTAKRTCQNKDNGCEFSETITDIKVTKANAPGFDCIAGGDVIYTAVATIATDGLGNTLTTPIQKKSTETKKADATGSHSVETEFDWSAFAPKVSSEGKLTDYTTGVKLKNVCSVCQKEEANTTAVTVSVTDPESFNPETGTISCGEDKEISFTATATIDGSPKTETKSVKIPKPDHKLKSVAGKRATCNEAGIYAHFECENCHSKFWDEDAEDALEANDESIAALGHVFGIPVFSWMDPVAKEGKAEAAFKCTREGCTASIVRDNLDVATEGKYLDAGSSQTCGDTVTLSYAVKVEFDRTAVVSTKQSDGSYKYTYDVNKHQNPFVYNGFVNKDATLNHDFEVVTNWNGTADANGTYDAKNGVTSTLTCKVCGGAVTFNSATGTVQGSGTVAGTTGTIELTPAPDAPGAKKAGCTTPGKDVYSLKIALHTHDGKTKETYDIPSDESHPVYIENIIPATGHSYTGNAPTWNGAFDSNKMPTGVSFSLSCGNCSNVLESSAEGVSMAFEKTTDTALGYESAECTTPGMDVWTMTITDANGDQITEYNSGKTLCVQTATKKLGHKYGTVPVWDWSEYGKPNAYDPNVFDVLPVPGKVYATYTCTNPDCDGLKDTADTTDAAEAPATGTVKPWIKKQEAAVTKTETAVNCEKDGVATYTATVGQNTKDTKTGVAKATGHDWEPTSLTWSAWEKVTENGADVMMDYTKDGKTYKVPVYKITASLRCKKAGCPLDGNTLAITGRTDTKLTEADKTKKNYVEAKVTAHTANTCATVGSTTYAATTVFVDKDGAPITFAEGMDTNSWTQNTLATGHDYEIKWTWKGKETENGEEVTVTEENEAKIIEYTEATVTRKCKNEPDAAEETATVSVTPTYEGNNSTLSCTQGVIAYYEAKARVGGTEGVADSGTEYSDNKVIVRNALGHNFGWIINKEWNEITGETTGIKAYYGCLNEHTEDNWNGDDVKDVTVEKDAAQSSEPTCSTEGATVWNLKTADGTVIGSHAVPIPIVKDAHKAQGAVTLKWDTLKAIDRDANGKAMFSINGTRVCAYGEPHQIEAEGTATADLGNFSCGEAATVNLTFNFGKDVEIEGGATQPLEYEAEDHTLEFVSGVETETCGKPYYPDHFRCTKCGKAFLNPSTDSETVISTTENLAHQFGNPVFSWIEQGRTAQAVFKCSRNGCEETRQFTANVGEQFITKQPTCKASGTAYYPVNLRLTALEDKTGFDKDYYPGNVIETLPTGSHKFDADGNCVYECGTKAESVVKVVFYGRTGNIISEDWIERTNAASYTVNAAPNQSGYMFDTWNYNNTDYTNDGLQNKLRTDIAITSITEINVYAKYKEATESADVNVYSIVSGVVSQTPIESSNVMVGQVHSLTAEEMIGTAVFSHWSLDNKGESVLSINKNYNLFIAKAETKNIYAVYLAEPGSEKEPDRIVISDIYTSLVDGSDKLSFASAMSMPEGATWIGSGFMYSTSATFGTDKDATSPEVIAALTVGSGAEGVKQKALTGTVANVLTINLGVNNTANKARNVWVRGYLFYEDSEGNLHECYTDVVKTTFNAVKAEETTGSGN